jgi:hypothetical protein
MLAESLLIYGCAIGQCSDVVSAYNTYNPKVYKTVKSLEKKAERVANQSLGPNIVGFAVPIVAWFAKREAAFVVYKDMTIKVTANDIVGISLKYNF